MKQDGGGGGEGGWWGAGHGEEGYRYFNNNKVEQNIVICQCQADQLFAEAED